LDRDNPAYEGLRITKKKARN